MRSESKSVAKKMKDFFGMSKAFNPVRGSNQSAAPATRVAYLYGYAVLAAAQNSLQLCFKVRGPPGRGSPRLPPPVAVAPAPLRHPELNAVAKPALGRGLLYGRV